MWLKYFALPRGFSPISQRRIRSRNERNLGGFFSEEVCKGKYRSKNCFQFLKCCAIGYGRFGGLNFVASPFSTVQESATRLQGEQSGLLCLLSSFHLITNWHFFLLLPSISVSLQYLHRNSVAGYFSPCEQHQEKFEMQLSRSIKKEPYCKPASTLGKESQLCRRKQIVQYLPLAPLKRIL